MQEPGPPPKPSDELLRRMDEEVVGLSMSKERREALLPLLDGLLAEIRLVTPRDRSGAEPSMNYDLGDWTP